MLFFTLKCEKKSTNDEKNKESFISLKTSAIIAVIAAASTSGLAGIYLEKILKYNSCSIWIRNIQLG